MAIVGQALLTPEVGWRRVENNASGFTFVTMSLFTPTSGTPSGGTVHYSGSNNYSTSSVSFKFIGSKLRVYSYLHPGYFDNGTIVIDGATEKFTCQYALTNFGIAYEKLNLSFGLHTVTINQGTNGSFNPLYFDCIDIDDNGKLVRLITDMLPVKNSLEEVTDIGDLISCHYAASSGAFGSFGELGTGMGIAPNSSCVPVLTSNTSSPEVVVSASNEYTGYMAYLAFNRNNVGESAWVGGGMAAARYHWLKVAFTKPRTINSYKITPYWGTGSGPKDFKLQGSNNDVDWIDLDVRTDITYSSFGSSTVAGETKTFNIASPQTFEYYRIYITANGGYNHVGITELELIGDGLKPVLPLTPTATPNGAFYWVFVGYDHLGRKLFVADRNLQHSINWDTLNSVGIISGLPTKFRVNPILTADDGNVIVSDAYSANTAGWRAFNGGSVYSNNDTWASVNKSGYIGYDFKIPTEVTSYEIWDNTNYPTASPKDWTFEGWDGSQWVVLDTRVGITWTVGAKKEFEISNPSDYSKYRLNITANGGYDGTVDLIVGELIMYKDTPRYKFTTRLLSGGISATDKSNEWDKIIVESTLDGKIPAGDNTVWNWSGLYSWTSTTSSTNTNYRAARGNSTASYRVEAVTTSLSSAYGLRPMLVVEMLNALPKLSLVVDNSAFYDDVTVTGTITDTENDDIMYRILINGSIVYNWSDSIPTPALINKQIPKEVFNIGSNTIKVECKDVTSGIKNWTTIKVIRKDMDSFYISNAQCFNNTTSLKAGGEYVAYIKVENADLSKGYIRGSSLMLNLINGNGTTGSMKVAPIITNWSSNTVTMNSLPNIDINNAVTVNVTNNTGLTDIDATALISKILGSEIFGIAIYSAGFSLDIDLFNNKLDVEYQSTILSQPAQVFGNRVIIEWRPLILIKTHAYSKTVVLRSTTANFSNATEVFSTTNRNVTSFVDNTVTKGTYYYKVVIHYIQIEDQSDLLDFDTVDEPLFTQQDDSKTVFVSGVVKLASSPYMTDTSLDFSTMDGYTTTSLVWLKDGKLAVKPMEVI
jgi:hypothetical protein